VRRWRVTFHRDCLPIALTVALVSAPCERSANVPVGLGPRRSRRGRTSIVRDQFLKPVTANSLVQKWYRYIVSVREKLLRKIIAGHADANIDFDALCQLLVWLGFEERIRGDHHILARADIAEIVNLQPLASGKAKPYQVKQVRTLLVKHKLAGDADE